LLSFKPQCKRKPHQHELVGFFDVVDITY